MRMRSYGKFDGIRNDRRKGFRAGPCANGLFTLTANIDTGSAAVTSRAEGHKQQAPWSPPKRNHPHGYPKGACSSGVTLI